MTSCRPHSQAPGTADVGILTSFAEQLDLLALNAAAPWGPAPVRPVRSQHLEHPGTAVDDVRG